MAVPMSQTGKKQRTATSGRRDVDDVHKADKSAAADRVVEFVRGLIRGRALGPGDRLPTERQLATQVGVSRPSVRTGLHLLQAMGVVHSRQGSGTYIPGGPPRLKSEPLDFLVDLHGVRRRGLFEARQVLDVALAGLAARRATPDDIALMAKEVTEMFASLEDPSRFIVHDAGFHRAVAVAAHNPILASLVDMVSQAYYRKRRPEVRRSRDLRKSAEMHRHIYEAICVRDSRAARIAMREHLRRAQVELAHEEAAEGVPAGESPAPRSVNKG